MARRSQRDDELVGQRELYAELVVGEGVIARRVVRERQASLPAEVRREQRARGAERRDHLIAVLEARGRIEAGIGEAAGAEFGARLERDPEAGIIPERGAGARRSEILPVAEGHVVAEHVRMERQAGRLADAEPWAGRNLGNSEIEEVTWNWRA